MRGGCGATACIGPPRRWRRRSQRPADMMVAASCHTRDDLARAGDARSRLRGARARWRRRRRIRRRCRSAGTASRRRWPARDCRSTRWAGSTATTSTRRSTTARTASRCAARRGRRSRLVPRPAARRSKSSGGSTAGTRYDSLAHAPWSMRPAALRTERPPFRRGGPHDGRAALRACDRALRRHDYGCGASRGARFSDRSCSAAGWDLNPIALTSNASGVASTKMAAKPARSSV